MDDDPVERVRRDWQGRLSTLRAPGANARLRRAMRTPVRLRGLKAGAPEPELEDGAVVLAKTARRTGAWLKLTPGVFETATGLALQGETLPTPASDSWDRCLALVQLGGRLERRLGRRGVVARWLCSPNATLEPSPLDVLSTPGGVQALTDHLNAFDR